MASTFLRFPHVSPSLPSLFIVAVCLFMLNTLSTLAQADQPRPAVIPDVGIDQHLDAQVPLDLTFRDDTGRLVQLGDYFSTKPVILVFAYYQCPMLCPLVLDGVAKSLRVLSFTAGKEFTVITVSIDPNETPALATAKKEQIVQRYARPGSATGWHFLTGEPAAITQLAQVVGFRYASDKQTGQYAHAAGIVILTPQGRISRYFYGVEFAPRDVRLGLVEAAANQIGSLADQLLLLCYHYDPNSGKYTALTINVLRVAGTMTVLALGALIVLAIRWEKTRSVQENMADNRC